MSSVESAALPAERVTIVVLYGILATLGLSLVAFIEVVLRIPLSQGSYVLVGILGLLCAVITLKFSPDAARRVAVVSVAFVAVLLILFLTPWNTRKVFLQDFRQIDPRMTVGEVSEIMAGYKLVHQSATTMSFCHSDETRYDSDVGVVYLEKGKVVRTEFSPD